MGIFYFHILKILTFKIPSPSKFLLTFLGMGMGIELFKPQYQHAHSPHCISIKIRELFKSQYSILFYSLLIIPFILVTFILDQIVIL